MNNLDKTYTSLLQDILDNGVEKKDRTGTGTISVFGRQIRHKMSEGFPLLTTKKMYMKGVITELLWFLRGDTNIQSLVQNNCHIWDGDAYKSYLKNRDSFSNRDNVKEDVVINGMNGSSNRAYTMEEFINTIRTNNVFAERWGDLGKIYGHGWRNWNGNTENELYDEYLKKLKNS
jgi:thymidylate synthase